MTVHFCCSLNRSSEDVLNTCRFILIHVAVRLENSVVFVIFNAIILYLDPFVIVENRLVSASFKLLNSTILPL